MRNRIRGVTLIELLVVVVIVAILAAIAYPNYRAYVQKSKRNEAKAALLQIATNQERHYLNNHRYTEDMVLLGFSDDQDVPTSSGTYLVSVTFADARSYTATATYQLDDDEKAKCETFSINETNDKASAPRPDCWTSTQ